MDCSMGSAFGVAGKGTEEILGVRLESGKGKLGGKVGICPNGTVPNGGIGQKGALAELKAIGEQGEPGTDTGFAQESDFLPVGSNGFKCAHEGRKGIEEGDCKIALEAGIEFIGHTGTDMVGSDIGFEIENGCGAQGAVGIDEKFLVVGGTVSVHEGEGEDGVGVRIGGAEFPHQ